MLLLLFMERLDFSFFFLKGEPMRIIYRMRGLLGDATEEFIESLDSTTG